MKKLLSFLLALCLLLSMAGCKAAPEAKDAETTSVPLTTAENKTETIPETTPETEPETPPEESEITPLLYQVTDEAGHTIWLFGSIHVGRKDFYPLPDYVTDAFDQAEALAVEFDIRAYEKDLQAQIKGMSHLVYIDGSTIQDHIDPELYAQAAELLKDAPIPVSLLKQYKPMMWASLLQSSFLETDTLSTQLGIDMHMIDAAYDADKPVISIESADFQYAMLGGFSPELQAYYLEMTVAAIKDGSYLQENEGLVDLWAEGNEAEFFAYLSESEEIPEEEAAIFEEYNKAMVVDRNLSMTDFAENALKEGKPIMICVGAAHVVGEGAMAQLLQQRGYTVTKLSPN